MVRFNLRSFKGSYDFVAQTSVYKTDFDLGNTEVEVKHCPQTGDASIEVEGHHWEVGYAHNSQHLHAKKKWQIGKNNLLIMRQDVSNFNFGTLPSPEIQLENEVNNFMGLDHNKLELKYHTFWNMAQIEEAATFGRRYKLKGAIDSSTKLDGAKIALKTEVGHKLLDEVEISYSKKSDVAVMCKFRPAPGSTVKAKARPFAKQVTCDFECDWKKDGLKIELTTGVCGGVWSCPGLAFGFDF